MKPNLILIGSGGHAKLVIDILEETNTCNIIGVTSNDLKKGESFQGYAVLGNDEVLPEYRKNGIRYAAMGLGGYRDNTLRQRVYEKIKSLGYAFLNVIHPSAIISKTAKLGEGVVVFPGVILNTEVIIGNNSIIATGSTIDHETVIGNHVLVSAGVTIGANTVIGDNVLLALGSKVISGLTIKSNVLIAAGAVVVKDIEENTKVFGIPAKPIKSEQ